MKKLLAFYCLYNFLNLVPKDLPLPADTTLPYKNKTFQKTIRKYNLLIFFGSL